MANKAKRLEEMALQFEALSDEDFMAWIEAQPDGDELSQELVEAIVAPKSVNKKEIKAAARQRVSAQKSTKKR